MDKYKNILTIRANNETKYEINVSAFPCGNDWNVTVCGGTRHHVGAVAVCYPSEGSLELKAVVIPEHQDDLVAEFFAKKISLAFNCHTAVSAGIHIDNASEEEILFLVSSCEHCCDELIKKIRTLLSQ